MPTDIVMPQMGESIFEGTITKWLKQPGDKVQRDEPLFEISTDKVDAEIPAPASGTLQEIKVAGRQHRAGEHRRRRHRGDGDAAAAAAPAKAAPAPAKEAAPAAVRPRPLSRHPAKSPSRSGRRAEDSAARRKPMASPKWRARPCSLQPARPQDRQREQRRSGARFPAPAWADASPRKTSKPSSPSTPAEHRSSAAAAPAASRARSELRSSCRRPPVTTPLQPVGGVTPGELVPMSTMRKKIAEHMIMSKRTSAHVHGVFEVDMTRIVRLREKMKGKFEQATGNKLTFTPFFAAPPFTAMRKWPIINSSVEGDNIHYHSAINLGIAVALDWGLIVPVIKNAEERSFVGLQRAVTDLGERARTKKLKPDEVQGGTFTITNPGIFGAKFGMPIINQPQVAIMGIGGITKKPVVLTDKDGNDTIAIRSMMHMSIGYDHRIIDGAVADQFMVEVKKFLENWNEELL